MLPSSFFHLDLKITTVSVSVTAFISDLFVVSASYTASSLGAFPEKIQTGEMVAEDNTMLF